MNIAKPLLAILTCLPISLWALETVEVDVDKHDGVYYVAYSAVVEMPADQLLKAVKDYQHYALLSSIVTEVRLTRLENNIPRLSVTLRPCVIDICRTINKVSDVIIRAGGQVEFRGVDDEGDFIRSLERIKIEPYQESKERAIFSYNAQLIPGFFVPPIIGRWIVSRQVNGELAHVLNRLQKRYLDR